MAASLGNGVLHSVTSLLLRHCKPHFCRYGALGEVEEALKRKLQEQPKDMMLREEVSLAYPRCPVLAWYNLHSVVLSAVWAQSA